MPHFVRLSSLLSMFPLETNNININNSYYLKYNKVILNINIILECLLLSYSGSWKLCGFLQLRQQLCQRCTDKQSCGYICKTLLYCGFLVLSEAYSGLSWIVNMGGCGSSSFGGLRQIIFVGCAVDSAVSVSRKANCRL